MLRRLHSRAVREWLLTCGSTPMELTDRPVLVVAPHPDDETLGCGGLIARKRSLGIPVQVLFLTDGAASRDDAQSSSALPLVLRRRQEALAACQVLGVAGSDIEFLDLPDGHLAELSLPQRRRLGEKVGDRLRLHRHAEVLVPHRRDGHPDHEAAFAAVADVLQGVGPTVRLLQYSIWMTWLVPIGLQLGSAHLAGACRLDISEVLKTKHRAIEQYVSQIDDFPPGFLQQFRQPAELFFDPR